MEPGAEVSSFTGLVQFDSLQGSTGLEDGELSGLTKGSHHRWKLSSCSRCCHNWRRIGASSRSSSGINRERFSRILSLIPFPPHLWTAHIHRKLRVVNLHQVL